MPLSGMPMLKSVPERPDKTEKSARDFPRNHPRLTSASNLPYGRFASSQGEVLGSVPGGGYIVLYSLLVQAARGVSNRNRLAVERRVAAAPRPPATHSRRHADLRLLRGQPRRDAARAFEEAGKGGGPHHRRLPSARTDPAARHPGHHPHASQG